MIEKIIINIIKLLATIFMFFIVTDPIIDFVAKDYDHKFGLSWGVSMILAMFYIEIVEIASNLKNLNKDE